MFFSVMMLHHVLPLLSLKMHLTTSQDKWYAKVRAMKCSPAKATKSSEQMGNDSFESKEFEEYLLLFYAVSNIWALIHPGMMTEGEISKLTAKISLQR